MRLTAALLKLELRRTLGDVRAFLGVLGGAGRRGLGDSGRSGSTAIVLRSEPDLQQPRRHDDARIETSILRSLRSQFAYRDTRMHVLYVRTCFGMFVYNVTCDGHTVNTLFHL